jgi:hypothetical protein
LSLEKLVTFSLLLFVDRTQIFDLFQQTGPRKRCRERLDFVNVISNPNPVRPQCSRRLPEPPGELTRRCWAAMRSGMELI